MLGLLFMQTTCAAMDAFVRELQDVDGFAGPPVVMSMAEEARFVARCVEAAIRVKKLRLLHVTCSSRATIHKHIRTHSMHTPNASYSAESNSQDLHQFILHIPTTLHRKPYTYIYISIYNPPHRIGYTPNCNPHHRFDIFDYRTHHNIQLNS